MSTVAGADQRAWASDMTAKFGLRGSAVPLVAELYRADDPRLLIEYEHAVKATFRRVGHAPPATAIKKGSRLGDLLDVLDDAQIRTVMMWALLRQSNAVPYSYDVFYHQEAVLIRLGRRRSAWRAAELSFMLRCVSTSEFHYPPQLYPMPLSACERADDATLRECADELRAAERHLEDRYLDANGRRIKARAEALLLRLDDTPASAARLFADDDGFGHLLRANIPAELDAPGLAELLLHCESLNGTKPTAAWLRALDPLLAGATAGSELVGAIHAILEQVPLLGDDAVYQADATGYILDVRFGSERTVLKLRGLLWCVDALPQGSTSWAGPVLGEVARHTGTGKGGSKNLRAERLATTAVTVLAARGDNAAIAALARLSTKVTKKTIVKAVRQALDSAADRLGLTRDQLTERTVPDFGLGQDGTREEKLGEHTALLGLGGGAGSPTLTFHSATGRPIKSVPKSVRESHPERLKALRAELNELKVTLPAERHRIDVALGEGRIWNLTEWRQYYLEHPITGHYARQLIWEVSTDAGATWREGLPERGGGAWRLVGVDGTEIFSTGVVPIDHDSLTHVAGSSPSIRLRLWHPIRAESARVRDWRAHLMDAELSQPVKQAFREIYLLTPAEEATRFYSNRYAAHILKYGQAKALLTTRGWAGLQLGYWDGGYETQATRVYRHIGMGGTEQDTGQVAAQEWAATFYLELVEREADGYLGVSYCSSDQVRFSRPGSTDAVRLSELPPLVFSEAMRDLDLVVGVASIAADPEWHDSGEDRHLAYWRQTGFGELTESAEMRRTALERLIPRLKIAERLELTDRFLKVRGDLRTYKIHLGSANILMEPDDSYLCIVTGRGDNAGQVFLPFESGGGRLSVILSKAFLLADDTAITDPTITRQLNRAT